MRSYDAVLFDLGNTLVGYYQMADFPAIRDAAIGNVAATLSRNGHTIPPSDLIAERVQSENYESKDYCVRPLGERLTRIFGIDGIETMTICRAFMEPIFACAHLYDDTLSTLHDLRSRGIRTAVVSNSPWGSPASLWVEELERLGIAPLIDAAIFCGDVGWRKPAREIFDLAMDRLGVGVDRSLFVGDDPRWDVVGPESIGMATVLIDRIGGLRGVVPMIDREVGPSL